MSHYLKPQYYHIYGLIERNYNEYTDSQLGISRITDSYLITDYSSTINVRSILININFDDSYKIKKLIYYKDVNRYLLIERYKSNNLSHIICKQYLCTDKPKETEIDLKTDLYLLRGNL